MNREELNQKLESDGWSLKLRCCDAGGWKRPAKWEATLSRNGESLTTEYTTGCGVRVWCHVPNGTLHWNQGWNRWYKKGKQVEVPDNLYPSEEQQKRFEAITKPIEPELCDVLWGLYVDAQSAECNFEEFCELFDYSIVQDGHRYYRDDAQHVYHNCCAVRRFFRKVGYYGILHLVNAPD